MDFFTTTVCPSLIAHAVVRLLFQSVAIIARRLSPGHSSVQRRGRGGRGRREKRKKKTKQRTHTTKLYRNKKQLQLQEHRNRTQCTTTEFRRSSGLLVFNQLHEKASLSVGNRRLVVRLVAVIWPDKRRKGMKIDRTGKRKNWRRKLGKIQK